MFPVLGMGPARRLLWDSSQDEAWLLLSHGISAQLREGILHRWLLREVRHFSSLEAKKKYLSQFNVTGSSTQQQTIARRLSLPTDLKSKG